MNSKFEKLTEVLGLCDEGMEWLVKQPSAAEAWKKCTKGGWMAWVLRQSMNVYFTDFVSGNARYTRIPKRFSSITSFITKDKDSPAVSRELANWIRKRYSWEVVEAAIEDRMADWGWRNFKL